MRATCGILFCMVLMAPAIAGADETAADPAIDFNRSIRPLLSDRCFICHGPDPAHREADLRLDVEENAKEWVIVPGDSDGSELISRITAEDADMRMPPADSGKTLSAEEIELLTRWINQGAAYDAAWAYVPPQDASPPDSTIHDEWCRNTIDGFILARLKQEGLAPAPAADPITLVRRISFDLTGLPPQPEDVERFVANPSPRAYEQLVDRLLASDRFGERMALYWLDLVRYADTVGYHGDQDQNITPYRDYVIDAFNSNLPFDQFTREQLAGDLLDEPTIDQQIATGYNRMLQTSHEGGVQPKEYLAIYAADRVRNLSAVWLGGTLGCAQCHDHKFDPYTTRDFYAMEAFFADIDEARHFREGDNRNPTRRPPEIDVLSRHERLQVAAFTRRIEKLEAAENPSQEESAELQMLTQMREEIQKHPRRTMVTQVTEPRTIRILPRGNWLDDSGEIVDPAIPEFLGKLHVEGRRANRLDLANWLTDPQEGIGGLTARVMANRLWYLLFGVGLAKNLDDFGGQGEPPVHPELLDHLAIEFYENGWDIKSLVKSIVMSSTYQQSSRATDALRERDPLNRLYARQSTFRLPAEAVRDSALSVGGLLVLESGGPSARPYQPEGYYRHLNFPQRAYSHDQNSQQWRRGVYMHWQRQFLHPMLKAFDAPSREECTAERPRSNTPLAALVLLNDPSFVEAARGLASRLLELQEATDAQRIDRAFQLAVSRGADSEEKKLLLQLLSESRAEFQSAPASAAKFNETGDSTVGTNQDPVELAAWTQVARTILNLNETITRN